MSDGVKRTRAGQFAPGQSGNAAGARSRKPKELITLADIHRTVLEVASAGTRIASDAGVQNISMLERSIWVLASGKGNRLAAADFLDAVKSAAAFLENLDRYPLRLRSDGERG